MKRNKKDVNVPFAVYDPYKDVQIVVPSSEYKPAEADDSNDAEVISESDELQEKNESEPVIECEPVDEVKNPKKMSKEERFKFYAERRTNSILRELSALGDMAFTYAGAYDKEMVSTMMYTITKATEVTRDFYSKKQFVNPNFKFD